MDCPFCPVQRLSSWYLSDGNVKPKDDKSPTLFNGIVACKDLNRRGYKYRILVVGSGEKYHRLKRDYSQKEIEELVKLGKQIAQKHIERGWANRIETIDTSHFQIFEHFHIQLCMR